MKENKFQKQVKKILYDKGALVINVHGHGMQMAGLPDLQVIHRNWKGWLELKVEKGKASHIQRVIAAKIELRGVPIYVLRCVEKNYAHDIWPEAIEYTLENFQGKVTKTFDDLDSLLGILIDMEKEKQNENI